MAMDNTTFTMDDLERNPEEVMRLSDSVTCLEHRGEDIKYYCKDHNVPCCGTCFFGNHKACNEVLDLRKELPQMLCNIKPHEIIEDLKTIEIHLMKFIEFNDVMIDNVGPQIRRSMDQIREVKQKINIVLDEIEKHVKAESNRIYKEVEEKKRSENHLCMSLLQDVRTTQNVLEAVHYNGSDLQKFLMAEKVRSHLRNYTNLVGEKYEKIDTVSVKAEFTPTIQSILSVSVSELGKIICLLGYNTLPFIGSYRQTKQCQILALDVVDLRVPRMPRFTGITFLPGDKLLIIDNENNLCLLFSSTYQFITYHVLPGMPLDVCVLDDQEIAVSFVAGNNIHVLSVIGDVIKPVRKIKTKFNCNGIASAGKGEMVVNWYCGRLKCEWSLINAKGNVVHSHPYDCPYSAYNIYHHYVVMNNAKTRVLLSANTMDSLLCFNMDGTLVFTYKPGINFADPKGVAVDRYDNIYVVAHMSHNIHQLSPNGSVLKVLDSGVPVCPRVVCIHEQKNIMVVTGAIEQTTIHVYQVT